MSNEEPFFHEDHIHYLLTSYLFIYFFSLNAHNAARFIFNLRNSSLCAINCFML